MYNQNQLLSTTALISSVCLTLTVWFKADIIQTELASEIKGKNEVNVLHGLLTGLPFSCLSDFF